MTAANSPTQRVDSPDSARNKRLFPHFAHNGESPFEWEERAFEADIEMLSKMPFYQAATSLVGKKKSYLSAVPDSLTSVVPDPETGEISGPLKGLANYITKPGEGGKDFLLLGEVFDIHATPDNFTQDHSGQMVSCVLPYVCKSDGRKKISELSDRDAARAGYGNLQSLQQTLVAQAGDVQTLLIDEARKNLALAERTQGTVEVCERDMNDDQILAMITEKNGGTLPTIPVDAAVDVYDMEIATPQQMVEMAPELWPNEEAAAKHLNQAKLSIASNLMDRQFSLRPKAVMDSLSDITPGGSAGVREICQDVIAETEAALDVKNAGPSIS